MIEFGITYSWLLLPLIALGAAGLTALLYFKNKALNELRPFQKGILAALRFVAVFLIASLLLSPFIKSSKKMVQKPLVLFACDNSESMKEDRTTTALSHQIDSITSELENALKSKFELHFYTFGTQVKQERTPTFSEKTSNYTALISELQNRHFNQNIGALIIAGDGIHNQGVGPLSKIPQLSFPVYTIAMGDTTRFPDARIEAVRTNRNVFAGNKFQVEVDILLSQLKSKALKLSIESEGKELGATIISPTNNNFFSTHEFILEATGKGIKHFSARIEEAQQEKNLRNNRYNFIVNVLEDKQKILIISEGVHPDVGAIKNSLERQKSCDVSVFTEAPYPEDLSEFNLLILNQLPSSSQSMASVLEKARKERLPLLFIVGPKTFLPQLNKLQPGITIQQLAPEFEEAQALLNHNYTTFKVSEEFGENVVFFPPLLTPFADYKIQAEFTPLLFQKIKGIETDKPLILTGNTDGRKIGFILGSGIWRWRLNDYYRNGHHRNFNEFVDQLIQYLALRENEDNFIVEGKAVYDETENIILSAEVYNDAFQLITDPEVTITIAHNNGEKYEFAFDVAGNKYHLNAGNLPAGDYSYTAQTQVGNQTFTESGIFTITPLNIENIRTQANHDLLHRMADLSGGSMVYPLQIEQLIEQLKSNPHIKADTYQIDTNHPLADYGWLFFIILLLVGTEWFLRKYWGIY